MGHPQIKPFTLTACIFIAALACGNPALFAVGDAKKYIIYDDKPADLETGWMNSSYPLGNSYFGVNFFGGINRELWQFTEPSIYSMAMRNKYDRDHARFCLSSTIDLRFENSLNAMAAKEYRRELDIMSGTGVTTFSIDGVSYRREQITSFPDNCFAVKLTANQKGKISFHLKPQHSFEDYSDEYRESYRSGNAKVEGDVVVLDGMVEPYNTKYQVRIAVDITGGTKKVSANNGDGSIVVEGADSAVIYVTLGTNYRLEEKTFSIEPGFYVWDIESLDDPRIKAKAKKLEGNPLPVKEIKSRLAKARAAGWEMIYERHTADVRKYMDRCHIDLGGVSPNLTTKDLLRGMDISSPALRYLEELYFQYGRYLMVGSSRPGTLPAGLQGKWNNIRCAPWTGAYWANVNVQMNYWPVFNCNLAELVSPYYDLWNANFKEKQRIAKEYLKEITGKDVDDVWMSGTENSAYAVGEITDTGGIGNGPFLLTPLWDWYNFTGDTEVLKKIWPMLLASSRLTVHALKEQSDGTILADPSSSPEAGSRGPGSTYDQSMVYEGHKMTLEAARILGKKDPILKTIKDHIGRLDPIIVGDSGQIKEWRQETTYGSKGAETHRHIAHLIALVSGTIITEKPEWIEAAKKTLNFRGDQSTGWAMALRLNGWARGYDGERSHKLLADLLQVGTYDNLWDAHPPFQIDGNFGGTAGIMEMVLQSHRKDDKGFIIDLLPATPYAWKDGSFQGARARGGFELSAKWKDMSVTSVTITSLVGQPCSLHANGQVKNITLAKGESLIWKPKPLNPSDVEKIKTYAESKEPVFIKNKSFAALHIQQPVNDVETYDIKPGKGRYVRISLPGQAVKRELALVEVQVFNDKDENTALGKKASQNGKKYRDGTYERGGDPKRAVDGKTKRNGSESETYAKARDAWWEVDLGSEEMIKKIVLWNRIGLGGRLNFFTIEVLDADRKPLWMKDRCVPGARITEFK